MATGIETEEALTSGLLSLASRRVLQAGLEAEQRETWGGERYERRQQGTPAYPVFCCPESGALEPAVSLSDHSFLFYHLYPLTSIPPLL